MAHIFANTANADVNVKDFGAKGDGITDDTSAIIQAFKYATAATAALPGGDSSTGPVTVGTELVKGKLYFPAGKYIYRGKALSATTIEIRGDGLNSSMISVDNHDYFLRTKTLFYLHVTEMSFVGGKGVINHTGTGPNVRMSYTIDHCTFSGYTDAAIASQSSDMPAWRIKDNIFLGSSAFTSRAIVLSGVMDNSEISENQFWQDRYNIVLENYDNAYIHNNDFIHWHGHPKDTAAIWLVAYTGRSIFNGLVISENKFGNENLSSTDFLILIAAKSGEEDLTTASHSTEDLTPKGLVAGGFTLRDNNFTSNGGYQRAIISTYTSYLEQVKIDGRSSPDTPPFLLLGSYGRSGLNSSSEIDLGSATNNAGSYLIAPFEKYPMGASKDPFGYSEGTFGYIQNYTVGTDPSFNILLDPKDLPNQLARTPSAEVTGIRDAYDNPGAARLKYTNKLAQIAVNFGPVSPGKPLWIEMDLRASPTNSAVKFCFNLQDSVNGHLFFRRCSALNTEWRRYRFWYVPENDAGATLAIPAQLLDVSAEHNQFDIGRVIVYQASEPVTRDRTFVNSVALEPTSKPNEIRNRFLLFVDSADGQLKLMFPNGSVHRVAVDSAPSGKTTHGGVN